MFTKTKTIRQRFFEKVDKTDTCWLWTASCIGGKGLKYGNFWSGEKLVTAHRMSFFLSCGRWPQNDLMHSCDNPKCVNPDHLREATHAENIRDAFFKKRMWQTKVTHCPKGHEYNLDNIVTRKNRPNSRGCKLCTLKRHQDRLDRIHPDRTKRAHRSKAWGLDIS